MSGELREVIAKRRIVVCCGAGGVGKTTVSAALAVAAARLGRRVLVVTIDPSKRLAETLGISRSTPEPVPLSAEALRSCGIEAPGTLAAWMLDPHVIADSVVERFADSKAQAQELRQNRIYGAVTDMVAGMQEYTAVQALYDFVHDERFDLVVLDTPPSRNALYFLEAPRRLARFLDGRVFRFFLPNEGGGLVGRAASTMVRHVLDAAFGKPAREELLSFFGAFATVLKRANDDATKMQDFFRRPDAAFLVVTSPAQEALQEARYFEEKTRDDLQLPLVGFLLNRSMALRATLPLPEEAELQAAGLAHATIVSLLALAQREALQAREHAALLAELDVRVGPGGTAQAMPYLTDGVDDLVAIGKLADGLLRG